MKITSRSILVWFCFLVLAFVNGAFRELVMIKFLGIGALRANQLSCLTGIALWTSFHLLIWRKLEVKRFSQALLIGMGWLVATMLFETFIINRNLNWSQILHTYDVSAGQYWGLVLLWIGLMPLAAYSLDASRRYPNTLGKSIEKQTLRGSECEPDLEDIPK
jgi:hypothetical protein